MALPAPSVFPSSSSSSSASHPFGWFHPGTNRTDSRGLPLFLDGPRAGFVLDEVRSSVVQTRGSGCRGSSKHRRRARSWAGARQRVEASDQGERRQAKEAPSVAGGMRVQLPPHFRVPHGENGCRRTVSKLDFRERRTVAEATAFGRAAGPSRNGADILCRHLGPRQGCPARSRAGPRTWFVGFVMCRSTGHSLSAKPSQVRSPIRASVPRADGGCATSVSEIRRRPGLWRSIATVTGHPKPRLSR